MKKATVIGFIPKKTTAKKADKEVSKTPKEEEKETNKE